MTLNFFKNVGLGLRPCHYSYIKTYLPPIPWFEVLTDNYINQGASSLFHLEQICQYYPVTFHGVGMSLGSTDPLNLNYLKKLKALIEKIAPLQVSDHLCWTALNGHNFHELLPLPYTQETIKHVSGRIQQVQDYLGKKIMIENVSSYLQFKQSTFTEWEFLKIIANEADCLILLDINNIYISAYNNNFNPIHYLNHLEVSRVAQFHLAGFEKQSSYLLDNHGNAVQAEVLDLYQQALCRFGAVPTSIEWDNAIPKFIRLQAEVNKAQKIMDKYLESR